MKGKAHARPASRDSKGGLQFLRTDVHHSLHTARGLEGVRRSAWRLVFAGRDDQFFYECLGRIQPGGAHVFDHRADVIEQPTPLGQKQHPERSDDRYSPTSGLGASSTVVAQEGGAKTCREWNGGRFSSIQAQGETRMSNDIASSNGSTQTPISSRSSRPLSTARPWTVEPIRPRRIVECSILCACLHARS